MNNEEMMEPNLPLSEQASAKVDRPAYWRDPAQMVVGTAGHEYEKAFFELQTDIEPVLLADETLNLKFKTGGQASSKYTSLVGLMSAVRPIIKKHNFTLKQFAGSVRAHTAGAKTWWSMPIATRLCHVESYQWEMVLLPMPIEPTLYSFGGAMTYGKRYSLFSFFGIATADDDAFAKLMAQRDEDLVEEATKIPLEKIAACKTEAALVKWGDDNKAGIQMMSEAANAVVRRAFAEKLDSFRKAEEAA